MSSEKVTTGICIKSDQANALDEGKTYYLFTNGDQHYYASRFNNSKAHFGCYQANRFDINSNEVGKNEEQLSLF